jgi:outer membrane protein OmpA-like peptidoglycan-associated protein
MAMRGLMVIATVIGTLPVLLGACASRDWIHGLFVKQEAEIGERLAQAEGRLDTQVERVDGLGTRVAGLESSVGDTAEIARTARERAEIAMNKADFAVSRADVAATRADAVDRRLTRFVNARPSRESVRTRTLLSTVHVRFGFNRSELDDEAETALISVVRELRENPGITIDLEGFTDSAGARDYNVQLSLRRVDAVRRYLIAKGIESPRIMHSSAVGPSRDVGVPEEHKRRVTVKLMKFPE